MSGLVQFKGFLDCPAKAVNAGCDSVVRYPGFVAPLGQCHGDAFESYVAIVCSVVLLFFHRSPTAVPRFIATMVFNTVNRMVSGWARSHVFQKEPVIVPAITNGARFIMPVREVLPNPIGARFAATPCLSVDRALFVFCHNLCGVVASGLKAIPVNVLHQAAARSRIAKDKSIGWGNECIAAIALALPRSVMLRVHPKAANGCQAGKFLSCQIFGASHERY